MRILDTREPLLVLDQLKAGYGKREILRGLSLCVGHSEVVALLGANGSGKSTVLNAISGFVRCSAGSIRFRGRELRNLPTHKTFGNGVVQVSQQRDLFLDLPVDTNLWLGAAMRLSAVDAKVERERVFEYFPDLWPRRAQNARMLSGGEQQMLTIGRALMSRPDLMLLDEPSSALSPRFVQQIATILGVLKTRGVTMLLVEQNLDLALDVADRLCVLKDGEVISTMPTRVAGAERDELVRSIYF